MWQVSHAVRNYFVLYTGAKTLATLDNRILGDLLPHSAKSGWITLPDSYPTGMSVISECGS